MYRSLHGQGEGKKLTVTNDETAVYLYVEAEDDDDLVEEGHDAEWPHATECHGEFKSINERYGYSTVTRT